jgi:hypothetical protein
MHLEIVEIKDDLIVLRDGQRTFEQAAEPKPATVSLESGADNAAATSTLGKSASTLPSMTAKTQRTFVPPQRVVPEAPPAERVISEQESAAMEALVERLKNLRRKADGGDAEQAMDDLVSGFKASEVSSEEAEKLDRLGKDLKRGDRDEPNVPKRIGSKIDNSIPRRPSISTRDRAARP